MIKIEEKLSILYIILLKVLQKIGTPTECCGYAANLAEHQQRVTFENPNFFTDKTEKQTRSFLVTLYILVLLGQHL